jgi:adenylate cyclase
MAGSIEDFKKQVSDEVAAILAGDFSVGTTTTTSVPHSGDPAITFPNLDNKTLKTKIWNLAYSTSTFGARPR